MPCLHSVTIWDLLPTESESLRVLLDPLTEREPESVAAFPPLPEVGLRLGAFLLSQRLRVREPNAPSTFLDGDHHDLELAPHGKRAAQIGATRGGQLGNRHQSSLSGTEPHEDAE